MNHSVPSQKCKLPRWLVAGLWFMMAATLPVFLALQMAPGRLYDQIAPAWSNTPRWPGTQADFNLLFISIGLLSAFIGGATIGKAILSNDVSNNKKVIVIGLYTVLCAHAIFGFEYLLVSRFWLSDSFCNLTSWMYVAGGIIGLFQNVVFSFLFVSWTTIPSGILAAWLLNKNRWFFVK